MKGFPLSMNRYLPNRSVEGLLRQTFPVLKTNQPVVREVTLQKEYAFQYENFVLSSQQELYLLLEKDGSSVSALKFRFSTFKYGSPNFSHFSQKTLDGASIFPCLK